MNLEIKLYGPNDKGIPEIWPEKVKELKEGEVARDGYIQMTKEDYDAYVLDNQDIYDQWEGEQDPIIRGNEFELLTEIINGLKPFEKVVFRQSGLMGAIFDRSLYEAFVILSNLSVSGKLADAKNQMLVILEEYQTPLK